jgi:hypothetical protein
MKQLSFSIILSLSLLSEAAAQTVKQYDIFSYTAPAGFTLKEQKQRLVYEIKEGYSFCQLHIWPAQQSSSNPQANFKTDWDYFAGNLYKIGDPSEKQVEKQNGWNIVTGVGPAETNGLKFIVSVSTFTQNDISWCAIAQFNDEKYAAAIDQFLASVKADVKKMVRKNNQTNAIQVGNTVTPTTTSGIITKSTTNFDDGWTSTITKDYVQVTKNGTEVRLYYVNAKIDQQRPLNTSVFEPYYWDAIVKSAFTAGQPMIREKEQYSYSGADIWEASATNRETSKVGYLGMRLVFRNGACLPIVVIAPDKNSYYSLFGTDADFTKMFNYNKFAVTQKDLIGIWKSFEAGSMNYYNIYTGDYAGMSTASTNDKFVFNSNGTYQSEHAGTITFQGSVGHGKSAYNGKFSTSDWVLTASNRGANDPGQFSCQFEAVKGGCMLRLVNKKFTGNAMTLFKSK